METSKYQQLASLNVNEHVEKKNGLSYLSWAWAVDQLLRNDPNATWEYRFNADGQPFINIFDTAMVFCTVNAFGVSRTAQLPVMNYKNQPIPQPNSFEVNTAMQRCLAKAIALHGIGLYIYAGEDLPVEDGEVEHSAPAKKQSATKEVAKIGEPELRTIVTLAERVGVDLSKICEAYKIDSIEKLPLSATAAVVDRLQKKAKEQVKG